MKHEIVFLFEYGPIVPAVLKCSFRHKLCKRSLPIWRKVIPYLLIFAPIKDFLDVYNVKQNGQS